VRLATVQGFWLKVLARELTKAMLSGDNKSEGSKRGRG
jgi:hypothetical protein